MLIFTTFFMKAHFLSIPSYLVKWIVISNYIRRIFFFQGRFYRNFQIFVYTNLLIDPTPKLYLNFELFILLKKILFGLNYFQNQFGSFFYLYFKLLILSHQHIN